MKYKINELAIVSIIGIILLVIGIILKIEVTFADILIISGVGLMASCFLALLGIEEEEE